MHERRIGSWRSTFEPNRIWNLCRLAVFPFSTGGTDDGTLFVTVAARDPDSDIGADLDIRRLALARRSGPSDPANSA
jgi:hypothetical protein